MLEGKSPSAASLICAGLVLACGLESAFTLSSIPVSISFPSCTVAASAPTRFDQDNKGFDGTRVRGEERQGLDGHCNFCGGKTIEEILAGLNAR